MKFTGKDYDEAAGLYYFNARWYDAELGRFTTEDPARDGLNWYVYVRNNPLRYVDPTGLVNWDVVADGSVKAVKGALKTVMGVGAVIASSGTGVASGGVLAPVAVGGIVVGSIYAVDGFVEATVGVAETVAGLMEDNPDAVYDNPDSMSEILGIAGDELMKGVTGEESDVLQNIGKWVGGQPADTLDFLFTPTDLGAPTLEDMEFTSSPISDFGGGE